MTTSTKKLLVKIGATEEAALLLTKRNSKDAQELVDLGLAIYIHRSHGGADVCLTAAGLKAYDKLTEDKE